MALLSRLFQPQRVGFFCAAALLFFVGTFQSSPSHRLAFAEHAHLLPAARPGPTTQVAPARPFLLGEAQAPLARSASLLLDSAYLQARMPEWAGTCSELFMPETCLGGVDYSDPAGGGVVPLQRVDHRLHEPLTRGFRIGDFASNDGAPYARISTAFVKRLDRLRVAAGGTLTVLSGYRYPAYNHERVGGAERSLHMAGRAADVYAPGLSPLELAALAIETMGCSVGLGLGPGSLHVDDSRVARSWTYPGAELNEARFDAWLEQRCGPSGDDEVEELELFVAQDSSVAPTPDTLAPVLRVAPHVATSPSLPLPDRL